MIKKINVEVSSPERLDLYMSRVFDSVSRSKWQKLIKEGKITVDGKMVPVKFHVEQGMTIEIGVDLDAKQEPITPPPLPEILYEDADVLVLNKPAGLKVHASNNNDRGPNLVHALLAARPEVASIGDKPDLRPGLVHRLDKDASGVLVVAKTQAAFEHLKAQFKERRVKKIYTVLIYGSLPKDHDLIEFEIQRGGEGRMAAHPKGSGKGREAKTEYDVLQRFATTTLARVQIHTGRTHQIRAHFFATQHPVVGDTLYTRKMKNIHPIPLNRLFLHAAELMITLPSGEEKTFTASLPEELETVLESLS
ncbi:TPA: RluA family pseudouridine synthase [Candidatus Uhrbacteria bacterium]|nr:RluA family pseudouridine synthase [Candidatus Uhrbacteria bacterium]